MSGYERTDPKYDEQTSPAEDTPLEAHATVARAPMTPAKKIIALLILLVILIVVIGGVATGITNLVVAIQNNAAPSGCELLPTSLSKTGNYIMSQQFITRRFHIYEVGKNEVLATLKDRTMRIPNVIDFMDSRGLSVSTATAKVFSLTTHLDVTSCNSQPVNIIEKELKIGFTKFNIMDEKKNIIADAEYDFTLGTKFGFYTRIGRKKLAEIHNQPFAYPSTWTVDIFENAPGVDNQVYFYVAALLSKSKK